jgi:hypothetical protein
VCVCVCGGGGGVISRMHGQNALHYSISSQINVYGLAVVFLAVAVVPAAAVFVWYVTVDFSSGGSRRSTMPMPNHSLRRRDCDAVGLEQ